MPDQPAPCADPEIDRTLSVHFNGRFYLNPAVRPKPFIGGGIERFEIINTEKRISPLAADR